MTRYNLRSCSVCGVEYPPHFATRRYCSSKCSNAAATARLQERSGGAPIEGMSTATAGAVGELVVSVDLMRLGYDVFRAVSASAPCDLIACKGSRLVRVEVRSASITVAGKGGTSCAERDWGRCDCYALVTRDGRIAYYPEDRIPERASDFGVSDSFRSRADRSLAA